jgi:sirohydrochlorin cobaltochelatase
MANSNPDAQTPIVLAAFGTTTAAREGYALLDRRVKEAFPGRPVHWAYTSRMVRHFSKKRHGLEIGGPGEVLQQLQEEGHPWAVLQSLHLTCGHEFYKLVDDAAGLKIRTSVGLPLLATPWDYEALADAVLDRFRGVSRDTALVFVGHGTDHPIWCCYPAMEKVLRERAARPLWVGVVEGTPGPAEIVEPLQREGFSKALLVPFMLVAGVHVREDLAGPEDSWRSIFRSAGLEVDLESEGLISYPGVAGLFVDHIQEALDAIPC